LCLSMDLCSVWLPEVNRNNRIVDCFSLSILLLITAAIRKDCLLCSFSLEKDDSVCQPF